jgi:hypothetical protein
MFDLRTAAGACATVLLFQSPLYSLLAWRAHQSRACLCGIILCCYKAACATPYWLLHGMGPGLMPWLHVALSACNTFADNGLILWISYRLTRGRGTRKASVAICTLSGLCTTSALLMLTAPAFVPTDAPLHEIWVVTQPAFAATSIVYFVISNSIQARQIICGISDMPVWKRLILQSLLISVVMAERWAVYVETHWTHLCFAHLFRTAACSLIMNELLISVQINNSDPEQLAI